MATKLRSKSRSNPNGTPMVIRLAYSLHLRNSFPFAGEHGRMWSTEQEACHAYSATRPSHRFSDLLPAALRGNLQSIPQPHETHRGEPPTGDFRWRGFPS